MPAQPDTTSVKNRPCSFSMITILLVVVSLCWIALTPQPAYADGPIFRDNGKFQGEASYGVAIGDLDDDGDLDAFIGTADKGLQIWFNDGTGSFVNSGQTLGTQTESGYLEYKNAVLGDLDGDGDLDTIVRTGSSTDPVEVWLNNGDGQFDTSNQVLGVANSIALGDLDGDGDFDAVLGNDFDNRQVWFNTGEGRFVQSNQSLASSGAIVVGDIDDDDDLDIVGSQAIWRNNGSGSFTATGQSLNDDNIGIALGDLNGDGHLDIVTPGGFSDHVWINDGSGNFTGHQALELAGNTRDVALGDLDLDGDLDIYMAEGAHDPNMVWLNDGDAHFSDSGLRIGSGESDDVALADVDGDGDLDAFMADCCGPNRLWLNDKGDNFVDSGQALGNNPIAAIAIGDLNSDDHLDIFLEGAFGESSTIWWNNGQGSFFENTDLGFNASDAVALGDLNGDNHLDILVAGSVLINDGNGAFSTSQALSASSNVALGDVDQNGTLDAFIDGTLWLNDGTGQFSVTNQVVGENLGRLYVALGDLDGDGDLDAYVTDAGTSQVWFNDGQATFTDSGQRLGISTSNTNAVALGDLDGDGDLDAFEAIDNSTPDRIWFNDGHGFFAISNQLLGSAIEPSGGTTSDDVALGDLDGDGDLDALVGHLEPDANTVWLNDGTGFFLDGGQVITGVTTLAVALGDLNNDGVLDGVLGTDLFVNNRLYWGNAGGPTRFQATVTKPGLTPDADFYSSPIIQDNFINPPLNYTLSHPDSTPLGYVRTFYSLNGGDNWQRAIPSTTPGPAGLAANANGSPHTFPWDTFASGFFGQSDNVVFRIEAYPQPPHTQTTGTYAYVAQIPGPFMWPYASATTFPFRAQGTQVRVFAETLATPAKDAIVYRLPKNEATGGFPLSNLNATPYLTDHNGYLIGRGQIAIDDTLVALRPIANTTVYRGALALDGFDDFVEVPSNNSLTPETSEWTVSVWLKTTDANGGIAQRYRTDEQDFYELSVVDGKAVFSFSPGGNGIATAQSNTSINDGEWHHIVGVRSAARTGQLYVDGVLEDSATAGGTSISINGLNTPLIIGRSRDGAYLAGLLDELRIWREARTLAQIQRDGFDFPSANAPNLELYWPADDQSQTTVFDFTANNRHGTLQGVTWSGLPLGSYTYYHTNIQPTGVGVNGHLVSTAGVQEIVVSADNPLLLFDLNISLEWDARHDTAFLEQLEFDLQRASEVLFDVTDGQVALGNITLHHNQENWFESDIQLHASNALRPFATVGGIRNNVYTETIASNPFNLPPTITLPYDLTYGPGSVNMGSVWNRFGEASGELGEDWPRTLAHELGHYLFYLYDNYIGLNDEGVIIPIANCQNSLMTDQYRDDFSEFRTSNGWSNDCANTLSAQRSGRSDWETITTFYDQLIIPNPPLPGPITLPFDFTRFIYNTPSEPATTLDVPLFYLTDESGAALQPGRGAEAFLYQADDRVIALGRPSLDRVRAYGASIGDTLCVYQLETQNQRLGCEMIQAGDDQVTITEKPGWLPQIIVSPVTSQTIDIEVSQVPPGLSLQAQLFPPVFAPTEVVNLTDNGTTYTGRFELALPSAEGKIRVWVNEAVSGNDTRRESITNYAIGGNPGRMGSAYGRMGSAYGRMGSAYGRMGSAYTDVELAFGRMGSAYGRMGSAYAPAVSPDGQAILFGEVVFAEGQFYALQKATTLPNVDPWLTVVGSGYYIIKSPNAPDLSGTSLSFRYLGRDVPPGEEDFLSLYYWDGTNWERLETVLNKTFNEASAATKGEGLYALMSTIPVPLNELGWNLVAYPVQDTRDVADALASIDGAYSHVYGYEATDSVNPWRLYAPSAPSHVNTLTELTFGQGYWISATQTIPWFIRGMSETPTRAMDGTLSPPATYYGTIKAGNGFTPTVDQTVIAKIQGHVCGQASTVSFAGNIVYSIQVSGLLPTTSGCGLPGKAINFEVNGTPMATVARWQNNSLEAFDLSPDNANENDPNKSIFLPLIFR